MHGYKKLTRADDLQSGKASYFFSPTSNQQPRSSLKRAMLRTPVSTATCMYSPAGEYTCNGPTRGGGAPVPSGLEPGAMALAVHGYGRPVAPQGKGGPPPTTTIESYTSDEGGAQLPTDNADDAASDARLRARLSFLSEPRGTLARHQRLTPHTS